MRFELLFLTAFEFNERWRDSWMLNIEHLSNIFFRKRRKRREIGEKHRFIVIFFHRNCVNENEAKIYSTRWVWMKERECEVKCMEKLGETVKFGEIRFGPESFFDIGSFYLKRFLIRIDLRLKCCFFWLMNWCTTVTWWIIIEKKIPDERSPFCFERIPKLKIIKKWKEVSKSECNQMFLQILSENFSVKNLKNIFLFKSTRLSIACKMLPHSFCTWFYVVRHS